MKTLVWIVIALLAGTTAWGWFHGSELEKQLVVLRDERSAIQHERDSLANRQPKLDTVWLVAKAKLGKTRTHTDSSLASDTTPIPRDTVQAIIGAEREACNAVILACDNQKANLTALADALRRENANLVRQVGLERKKRPGLFSGILTKAAWAGGGFLAGRLLH